MTSENDNLRETTLVHPNPYVPIANAVVGALILLLVASSAFAAATVLPIVTSAWNAVHERGLGFLIPAFERQFGVGDQISQPAMIQLITIVVSLLIFILAYVRFAVPALGVGARLPGQAVIQWSTMGTPGGVPLDLPEPLAVLNKMMRRDSYFNGLGAGEETAWFGLNAQFMSPVATPHARVISKRLSVVGWKLSITVVGAVAVSALILWAASLDTGYSSVMGSISALIGQAGVWLSMVEVVIPFGMMLSLILISAVLDYLFRGLPLIG
jgi:hypothetical protein